MRDDRRPPIDKARAEEARQKLKTLDRELHQNLDRLHQTIKEVRRKRKVRADQASSGEKGAGA